MKTAGHIQYWIHAPKGLGNLFDHDLHILHFQKPHHRFTGTISPVSDKVCNSNHFGHHAWSPIGFWRFRNFDVDLSQALHSRQNLAYPWPCQGLSQGWRKRGEEVSDGAVELVFELNPLNGIQTLLRDGRREVIYDGKIKEAEGVVSVGCINGFTVAVMVSKKW